MAKSFELDLSPLADLIAKSPEAAGRGAHEAMDQVKDDWIREARDIAPLDTGNLRRQIDGDVEGNGLKSEVVVTANAVSKSGGRAFNYGYYIHEKDAGGKQLRHPGTVKQFLDKSAENNKRRYLDMIEDEIKDELKRAGW